MILKLFALFWLVGVAAVSAQQHQDLPESHSVKPQFYASGFELADGMVFDSQGNLFVANYRKKGTIGRITPDGSASIWSVLDQSASVEEDRAEANGLRFDSEGRLIVADSGGGRLLRLSTDGKSVEVLADRYNGKRFNSIYDVALDLTGNIYFTDPGGSDAENPNGAVYRYDIKAKKIALIDSGLAFPNGIVVTSDQKQLCISESKRYRLLIYDLTAQGTLANRRVLIDFPTKTSGKIIGGKFEPDGIVLDRAGRLYVGMWQGGVINVIEIPSGRILRQYSAGGEKAANGCFYGGYFYIAVASKEAVFRLKLNVQGLP